MKQFLYALALAPILLAACSSDDDDDGGGGGGSGTLSLSATDDPFAFDVVDEATITIDGISVHNSAGATSGFTTLFEGTPVTLDLLSLRDGVTQDLGDFTLPAGTYRQFRLHVTSARLVLTNGNTFTTEDDTLNMTSQDTSGFKVVVTPPIQIQDGETTEVLLDFDLTHTFQPIPAADALTATSFNLLPVVHARNVTASGGMQGLVSLDGGGGVEDATIFVFNPGQTNPANAIATTGTNGLGEFTMLALPAGTFDVMAVHGTDTTTIPDVVVTTGSMTTVDVDLSAP